MRTAISAILIIRSKLVRGRKPVAITISARQQAVLQRLNRRQTAAQRLVGRARLILLAADGASNTAISKQLALDRGQVALWRARWLAAQNQLLDAETADAQDQQLAEFIETLLTDQPRPGTPPTFSPEQVVQIIALACADTQQSQRPISHWSARELAAEAIKRGIVERISARSVGRFLK
jgi:transposase